MFLALCCFKKIGSVSRGVGSDMVALIGEVWLELLASALFFSPPSGQLRNMLLRFKKEKKRGMTKESLMG